MVSGSALIAAAVLASAAGAATAAALSGSPPSMGDIKPKAPKASTLTTSVLGKKPMGIGQRSRTMFAGGGTFGSAISKGGGGSGKSVLGESVML